MKNFLSQFKSWLDAHKISSHAIAGALLGFFALYTSDQQFATWLNSSIAAWPKLVTGLGVAAGIYLRYSTSAKVKP